MSLTPTASLYYGFVGGCVSAAAAAGAAYQGRESIKGVEPDKVFQTAMHMLCKDEAVRKFIGYKIRGGEVKAYSSRGGSYTVRKGSMKWIRSQVEMTFNIKGTVGEGVATAVVSKTFWGQEVHFLSVLVLNDHFTYIPILGDELMLESSEQLKNFVSYQNRKP